jgi:hypothetical protein
VTEQGGEYRRGMVDQTLSEHAAHLAKINGSIDRFAHEVGQLTLAIQRLADAADADRSTVKVTAEALEKAEQARRDRSEQGWTPFQRVLAVLGGLAAVIGTIIAVLALTGHLRSPGGQHVKRALSPLTNPAGLTAAGMALYAAALMIASALHHHGVISVPVIVAAVSAVAALWTRQKVTPVADPVDGAGRPLVPAQFSRGGVIPPPPAGPQS